ncbi:phosphoribosylglycinamide formyltransferase [Aminipila sp.]|uniref:phosphoribosylglycinamide formyltransferase n=1 Tax=Aminipila sp. TaxID=2060095 RepID=UPI002896C044|nr:phosphoribosylglycinamide formyltransferase [Aminipila sp.]
MLRIAVLVSGGGTNLQAVIDSIEAGRIKEAEIACIISSNPEAFAIKRGIKHGIKTIVIDKKQYPAMSLRTKAIIAALQEERTDLVVLAGYMSVLESELVQAYKGRIINIHPSLIPKFCGKGFYGQHVHKAVLAAGEKVSGATVHFVDEGVDTGPIIMQKQVPVLEGDTPEQLAERVLKVEHEILTEAINRVIGSFNNNKAE